MERMLQDPTISSLHPLSEPAHRYMTYYTPRHTDSERSQVEIGNTMLTSKCFLSPAHYILTI